MKKSMRKHLTGSLSRPRAVGLLLSRSVLVALALAIAITTPVAGAQGAEMEAFTSVTEFFSLRVPPGWSLAEVLPGRVVILANSEAALGRYRNGAAVEPGDLVLNIGFLPFLLLQQRELRPLDIQFEATPDVFLRSLLPMFRMPDDAVFGDAERISLSEDREAGSLTVAAEGREGMILMFAAGDGVVAFVSTVGFPGELGAFQEVVHAVAATVSFSGAQDALYGALLGG